MDFIMLKNKVKQIGSFFHKSNKLEYLQIHKLSPHKHAFLHLLVDFTGSFRSFPIFQQRFRWYQAVKKYSLSKHYFSVPVTAEAITQT